MRPSCRIRACTEVPMRGVPATRGDLSRPAGTGGGPVEISPFWVRLVVRREQPVGGRRRRQLAGEHGVAHLVADPAYAGRVAQPLVELVADQRPGEVELLLRRACRPGRRRRAGRGGRGPGPTGRRRRCRAARRPVTTGGAHSPLPRTSRRAPASSRAAARASSCRSPSALLTAITSAISRMPFLMPWSWSPVRARVRKRNVSTIPATVTSDWPTPTVSTSTTSYAAASSTAIACTVARATPPRVPAAGEGRMKASGLADSLAIRVLSPSTEPPVRMLDGSTASTPTRWPCCGQPGAERLDERRLPDAGDAGDTDPDGRRADARGVVLGERGQQLAGVPSGAPASTTRPA